MAVYLHSLPPRPGTPGSEVALDPPPVRASTLYASPAGEARGNAEGLRLFEGSCASCHDWNGEGVQTRYGSLHGAQTVNDPEATNPVLVILRGSEIQTREGHLGMPAFRHAFTDAEVAAVANGVLQHFGNKRPTVTPDRVATARVASE